MNDPNLTRLDVYPMGASAGQAESGGRGPDGERETLTASEAAAD